MLGGHRDDLPAILLREHRLWPTLNALITSDMALDPFPRGGLASRSGKWEFAQSCLGFSSRFPRRYKGSDQYL